MVNIKANLFSAQGMQLNAVNKNLNVVNNDAKKTVVKDFKLNITGGDEPGKVVKPEEENGLEGPIPEHQIPL